MRRIIYGALISSSVLLFCILLCCLPRQVFASKQDIRVGILANRGIEQCYNEWNSTADYLSAVVPEYLFKIVALPFEKLGSAVANREIDFVVTNSAMYVELEQKYFCSRIATLVNRGPGKGCTLFGGVIFFRSDRNDIKTLIDLRGKKFVAVDEYSLGGWRAAWGELKRAGIDPHKDFIELKFAGTHDGSVLAVRDGLADAGTVRTDTLERMTTEGKVSLEDFRVIPFHGSGPGYDDFPFLLSTRLYPEWPFAKLRHTSDELARRVAAALLTLPGDNPAARSAKVEGWTIPYNYEPVDELLKLLRVGPYENFGKVTPEDVLREYGHLILGFGTLLLLVGVGTLYVAKLNSSLRKSRLLLEEELNERSRAEEEVQRLSRYNELILNTAGEAIVGLDLQGKVAFVNPAAASMTGYAIEELLGSDLHGMIHHTRPDGTPYPTAECPMFRSIKYASFSRVNDELLWKKDGTSFRAIYSSSPLIDNGQTLGAVIAFWDITDRIAGEEKLRRLLNQNQMILDAAGEGIVGLDNQGIVTFISPAAARLTGYEIDELIGKNLHDYLHHSKPYGTPYPLEECPMHHTLKSGKASLVRDEMLWRKNGTCFDATYFSNPIIENDIVIGAVVTFWDVTERKQTEAALRESERAREKEHQKTANLEALSHLAGGIAHDFNNLLMAILGNLSLGMVKSDEGNPLYQIIQKAEQATLKARGLAQQMLTFAKGGTPDKKHILLPDLIKEAAGFATVGSSARCEIAIPDHLWAIEADPDQITQVIQNLVINAAQAMPTGGTIKVGAEDIVLTADCDLPLSGGRYVRIHVQDHGIGIPPENRDEVFNPYFTTKEEGTGLGLTSVYSIVKKHGGYVTFDSETDFGTIFHVYLPASEKEAIPLQAASKDVQRGKGRLLIMDDEAMVREIVSTMVAYLGYEAQCVKDGMEALELYQKAKESDQPFDLVIMDLTIPGGMGGKEAVREILKIDPHAKVLVSSGYADDPIIVRYKDYGFCGAIKKPYRIVTFSKVLSKCLPHLKTET
jgi:PAS domain S-box-containing protein